MNSNNDNKNKLLGEPYGTASNKLRKAILFQLLQETGKDTCFQCGNKIENITDLSIEHKAPWMSAKNPVEAFFDLDNIAFSHLKCNVAYANKKIPHPNQQGEKHGSAKLTEKDVLEIRAKLNNGVRQIDIVKEYEISPTVVFKIKNNILWRYLND